MKKEKFTHYLKYIKRCCTRFSFKYEEYDKLFS